MMPPLPGNSLVPNVYCDIGQYLEEKIQIMKLYQSQAQEFPMPRCAESIRGLAGSGEGQGEFRTLRVHVIARGY